MNAPAAPPATRAIAPVAATPQSPARDGVTPWDAAVFRWTAPPSARRFRFQVAATADFSDPLVDLDGLAATELVLADALPPGPLVWRVRAGGAPWSPAVPFRAGTAADVAAAEAAASTAAAEEGARARAVRRAARLPGAAPLVAPPAPVWPFGHGPSLDAAAPVVDWAGYGFGAPPAMTALAPDPAASPLPLEPRNGAVVDAAAVALRWEGTPRAHGYDVEVSPDPCFAADVLTLDAGAATELSLPSLLPPTGHALHWRVRARTARGVTAWGPYGRFYPASGAAADRFLSALDAAQAARRKEEEYARRVAERALDLIPLYQRPDVGTEASAYAAILVMLGTGFATGLALLAFALAGALG